MMRKADTLFGRLFGIFLLAIVIAHLLAFLWFRQYGGQPPPPPPPPTAMGPAFQGPPPPPPRFGGPWVHLAFQCVTLVAAAWLGARWLARPIQRLSDAAERLSENLESPPLEERGPQEVRQAAHAFNRMQERIRAQVAQRNRMLAAVSHDLRTPLSRMRLRVEQVDDEALRGRLSQDLGDMVGMLDATLNYFNEQRAHESLQWFDLQALVESLAEDAQEQGEEVTVDGHCAPLRAQPLAMRSCIANLVDNALRYAGHAHIRLEDGKQQVRIEVRDHGPGIPAELRETVFEPFYRLEGSRNRNSGGIGLGLTIARDAARRQGGDLELLTPEGGGLLARLTLPRR
ncbi:ATP-binding protein [Pseudomonas sp. LFM046]|uniref:ATP-binding protein n=1 Tax=Pseudomonas sp. LFM046 TaxID=1608357 RepID=UPI000CCC66E9|nr:ATP-binding protein [Pseudomonas sp. LFM046]